MAPCHRSGKTRLLAISAAVAVLNLTSNADASSHTIRWPEDVEWTHSASAAVASGSSSHSAAPTPKDESFDGSFLSLATPSTGTPSRSDTINPRPSWLLTDLSRGSAASALDDRVRGDNDSGGSVASSSADGDAHANADVGDDVVEPEVIISTLSPDASDDPGNGLMDDKHAEPWTPSPSPTRPHGPLHRKPQVPESPPPVSIFSPQGYDDTPPPTPNDQATESPPPPRNELNPPGNPRPVRRTTKPPSQPATTTDRTKPPTTTTGTTKPSPSKDSHTGKSGSGAADGTRSLTDSPPVMAGTPSSSPSSAPAEPSLEDGLAHSGLAPSSPPAPAANDETIKPTTSTPEPSRRFQRGDYVIVLTQAPSPSGTPVSKSIVVSPSQSPALIVRGGQEASSTSTSSHNPLVYTVLHYLSSIAALLSLVWLIACSMLVAGSSTLTLSWPVGDPNQWEFGVFVAHIQGLASLSHLISTSGMPGFFVAFLDAFSWTSFLPIHGSTPAISNSRRLEAVILDGVVAFADRIGVNEGDILTRSVAAFVVVIAVIGCAVGLTGYLVQRDLNERTEAPTRDPAATVINPATAHTEMPSPKRSRTPLWISIGLLVLLWQFSLYPLALFASYEISMQLQATGPVRAGPFSLALLVLAFLHVSVLVASSIHVWRLNSRQKMATPRNLALWGSLFDGLRVQHRLFFIAFALVQAIRGVIIGCVVDGTIQLAVLLAIDAALLLAALLLRPFQPAALLFTISTISLRIATTALAFAFAASSSPSIRRGIAISLIAAHTTVLLLWLARHVAMVRRVVLQRIRHHHASDDNSPVRTPAPVETQEQTPHTAAALYTSIHQEIHSNERRGPGAPYSSAWDDSI